MPRPHLPRDETDWENSDEENERLQRDDGSSPRQGAVTRDMSPGSLYKALRRAQRKEDEAREEANSVKRELADAKNAQVPRGRGRPKKQKTHDDIPEDDAAEISLLGKKFASVKLLWLRKENETFTEPCDDDYDAFARFENEATKVQGQIRDLLDVLPENLWTRISDLVVRNMGTQRSNMAHRVRKRAGADIFDVPSTDLKTPESRRQFRQRIGWKMYKDRQGAALKEEYDLYMWAKVLHKDYNGKRDINKLFLSPIMFRVFASIIRGPTAVVSMISGGPPTADRKNKSTGELWGLTHTTPGAIAILSVYDANETLKCLRGRRKARWALSMDTCLQEIGGETGIDWQADFEMYLSWLVKGLRNNKARKSRKTSQLSTDSEIETAMKQAWEEAEGLFNLLGVSTSDFMGPEEHEAPLPSVSSWFRAGEDPVLDHSQRPQPTASGMPGLSADPNNDDDSESKIEENWDDCDDSDDDENAAEELQDLLDADEEVVTRSQEAKPTYTTVFLIRDMNVRRRNVVWIFEPLCARH
ncbi:hypothetical protein PLICRDRAFT_33148 [Plicaturopsis crispa FD-325 SS-3]|uniref:Uncharacterized protein n=1 Tax=Plicaturopsis crispa FD-325 SS-3 TaxID=944288 RepID=A0A0C9SK23_PLICR|nr:hypothetical protein PLICRDRAFT_33148 [Plicaturopsis crispa FD-325 SS-3]